MDSEILCNHSLVKSGILHKILGYETSISILDLREESNKYAEVEDFGFFYIHL